MVSEQMRICPHKSRPDVLANGLIRNRIRYIAVCPDCGLILIQDTTRKNVEEWVRENYPDDKGVE